MFSHHDYQTTNAKRAMEKTIGRLPVLSKSRSLLVLILQHDVVYVHCPAAAASRSAPALHRPERRVSRCLGAPYGPEGAGAAGLPPIALGLGFVCQAHPLIGDLEPH